MAYETDRPFSTEQYKVLDEIASRARTGKGSYWHNFTRQYASYLEPYRYRPIKLLEIGIFDGASVQLWEEYLPLADLHFADVTVEHVRYNKTRSTYHLISQADVEVGDTTL